MKYKIIALIVAGGYGRRFASKIPKQYTIYNDKPIITQTVEKFYQHPQIDQVKVVIRPEDLALYNNAVKIKNILPPTYGGHRRQDSVRLGLSSIANFKPEIVLIHDGCRPFISNDIISKIIETLQCYQGGVIAATNATDTIKMVDKKNNTIVKTIERDLIFHAQTPQGFIFEEIFKLHKLSINQNFTDDAAIFEAHKRPVKIVLSSKKNIKITTQEDISEEINNVKITTQEDISEEINNVKITTQEDISEEINNNYKEKICPLAKYNHIWYLLNNNKKINC